MLKKVLIALVIVVGVLSGCSSDAPNEEKQGQEQQELAVEIELVDTEGNANTTTHEFTEGQTLMEVLKANYEIDETDGFLNRVGDLIANPDNKEFLAIYVNDEMAMVGANDLTFSDGDKVTIRLETWE